MKIGFLGGGNMSEAIIKGLFSKDFSKDDIIVSEIRSKRRFYLENSFGIKTVNEFDSEILKELDALIIALKPKIVMDVLDEIKENIPKNLLVISIVPGIPIEKLTRKLSTDNVIRVMPNTPALIGKGISVLTKEESFDKDDEIPIAEMIFSSVGEIIWLDEEYFDAVVALSGSGPAYVFKFIETLVDSGVYLGLPREIAKKLVVSTIIGSGELVANSGDSTKELSDKVASPGGTTIAALVELERSGFSKSVINAVEKAFIKAGELG